MTHSSALFSIPVIALAILCLTRSSEAQRNPVVINSGELITEGVKLHDDGEYEAAVAKYAQVGRNDTNYVLAQYEMSYSLFQLELYDSAVKVCQRAMAFDNSREAMLYVNLGNALDNAGDSLAALDVYEKGIPEYPRNHMLLFNKAVTLNKIGKKQEAFDLFKEEVRMNPNHAGAHLNLGIMAAGEGNITEAILAINAFLFLEPGSKRAQNVVVLLDKLAAMKNESEPEGLHVSDYDFSDIELLVKNKIALSKKYKVKSKFDYPMVKTDQLVFEKLKYDKHTDDFFMQTYVPFFKAIYDEGRYETYSYYTLMSLESDNVQSVIKKNIAKLKDFNKWGHNLWDELHSVQQDTVSGKKGSYHHWYSNGRLQSVGELNPDNPDQPVGDWDYYFPNGKLQAMGHWNDAGQRTGTWKFWYNNGQFEKALRFKEGKLNGEYMLYYDNGTLNTKGAFKDGNRSGDWTVYTRAGALQSKDHYVDGKQDGTGYSFHPCGDKDYEINYKEGVIEGAVKEYYPSGKLSFEVMATEGKKNGIAKSYYFNGQLMREETFKDGITEGPYKSYYSNGALKEEGNAVKGSAAGLVKQYFRDGSVSANINYDESGKLNGMKTIYDYDGIKHYEWTFSKGEISGYRYFDKSGKVIAEARRKLVKFPFKGYFPDGTLNFEGDYKGSVQNGHWIYYNQYGVKTGDENYVDGMQQDESIYYNDDGSISSKQNFKDDKLSGYYISYFSNGKIKEEGNYAVGMLEGDWFTYTEEGMLETHNYYIQGVQVGYQQNFSVNGRISEETFFDQGTMTKTIYYDTTGQATDTIVLPEGTGTYLEKDYAGNKYSEGHYLHGKAHGDFTWFFPNGKVEVKGAYYNGKRNGTWQWYYENGRMSSETHYEMGDLSGDYTSFYENGRKRRIKHYEDDALTGAYEWYYDNGQILRTGQYVEGYKNGAFKYFAPDGQLMHIRYYNHGVLTALSYNGKDGKPVERIPLEKGNLHFTAYYQNGKKSVEFNLKNGLFDGPYKEYYPSGKVMEAGHYTNNNLDGPYVIYLPNGNPKEKEQYFMDNLSGVQEYYGSDGIIDKKLSYKNGKLHGKSQYFKGGKLIKTRVYYDGKLVREN